MIMDFISQIITPFLYLSIKGFVLSFSGNVYNYFGRGEKIPSDGTPFIFERLSERLLSQPFCSFEVPL